MGHWFLFMEARVNLGRWGGGVSEEDTHPMSCLGQPWQALDAVVVAAAKKERGSKRAKEGGAAGGRDADSPTRTVGRVKPEMVRGGRKAGHTTRWELEMPRPN